MFNKSTPWVARAWQHWHRPWVVTHASWLSASHAGFVGSPAHEPLLSLHYPAWCRSYGLDASLTEFSDSVWWRLFGLPPDAFDRASRLVGWTLLYAADRRHRLVQRGGSQELGPMRWALGRAHFVPPPLVEWVSASSPSPPPSLATEVDGSAAHLALATLNCCLPDESPVLWPRMRLRSARHAGPNDGVAYAMHVHAQMYLASLWGAATRHVMPDAVAMPNHAATPNPVEAEEFMS